MGLVTRGTDYTRGQVRQGGRGISKQSAGYTGDRVTGGKVRQGDWLDRGKD